MQELKPYMHYPNLKTILAVEAVLKKSDDEISRNEVLRRLENKTQRQTLNLIIEYLIECGKVLEGKNGIIWIFNSSKKLLEAEKRGLRVI